MTPTQAYSSLIRIAAQLARGDGLPSDFAEDYPHKTMRRTTVARMMEAPHDTARRLAHDVRVAADALRKAADSAAEQGEAK